MTLCCGPRDEQKPEDAEDSGIEGSLAGNEKGKKDGKPGSSVLKRRGSKRDGESSSSTASSSRAGGSRAFGTLTVRVERGKDLMGMDTNITVNGIETTLDAFVRLSLNGQEPFGKTDVQWRSKGDPEWGQSFTVDLPHPKSFLCVYVADDDPIFREGGLVSLNKNCGFIEIPLDKLPRNQKVKGWFVLNHPDQDQGTLGDRSAGAAEAAAVAAAAAAQDLPPAAGRIQLELTLETTAMEEFKSYMTEQPPVFEKSLPPLDVPGFIGDLQEVKRLILQRLVLAPIKAAVFAISWENPALSFGVLVWHWFICYFPRFIWSSIWLAVLLCFWHEIPEQKSQDTPEGAEGEPEARKNLVTGLFGGALEAANRLGTGVKDMASKPVEGAKTGGLTGLAKGMKDGALSGITHTGSAVYSLGKGVHDGVRGTVDEIGSSLHGPSLTEFQHILMLKPALRDMVRGQQPTVGNAHAQLRKVDDIFYWADALKTEKVVKGIAGVFVVSILFSGYSSVVSGYGYLILGTLVMISKAGVFKKVVRGITSAVAVKGRPKVAFKDIKWFEAVN